MRRDQQHRIPSRQCPRCGSGNWQTVELAYNQAVRRTTGGYESVSRFAESIAPPRRRSEVGVPLLTALGLGSATWLFLPLIPFGVPVDAGSITSALSTQGWVPAVAVGVLAFAVHAGRNIAYNADYWERHYRKWRRERVCRSCGHRFDEPGRNAGASRK